jgi:hypothetical protein
LNNKKPKLAYKKFSELSMLFWMAFPTSLIVQAFQYINVCLFRHPAVEYYKFATFFSFSSVGVGEETLDILILSLVNSSGFGALSLPVSYHPPFIFAFPSSQPPTSD